MQKSFDKNWEESIYLKGKQLNKYPYDLLVSLVANKFFCIPEGKRKEIKVLDLGCGAGNNAKFLAENGFDVYGIDGSKSVIKICKKRFNSWNLKGDFIQGDFLDLPYKDNFFDLAIDRESLYANKFIDIKNIIDNVHQKLKKNGLFISFAFNSHHTERELGKEMEPNTYCNFKRGSFHKAGKTHFIDVKEIYELYSKFNIENIMRHSLSEIYNKPAGFMEFDEYIIIAKK